MTITLTKKLLAMVGESGANYQEAASALRAAEALLVDLPLQPKSTVTINAQ